MTSIRIPRRDQPMQLFLLDRLDMGKFFKNCICYRQPEIKVYYRTKTSRNIYAITFAIKVYVKE